MTKKPSGIIMQFAGWIVLRFISDPPNFTLSVQSTRIFHLGLPNLLFQLQDQHLAQLWYQAGAFLVAGCLLAHKQEQSESSGW